MAKVTTVNVFEVERVSVRWDDECRHYQVVFEGADQFDRVEVNAWRDHGKGPPPALEVERAPEPPPEDKPMDPPNEEIEI